MVTYLGNLPLKARQAAEFFFKFLAPQATVIFLVKRLDEDTHAEMTVGVHKNVFIITVNSLILKIHSLDRVIEHIAHEFIHVNQVLRGDLKVAGDKATWKNAEYTIDEGYWDAPWEVEARRESFQWFRKFNLSLLDK
jgi:hypothetical protein